MHPGSIFQDQPVPSNLDKASCPRRNSRWSWFSLNSCLNRNLSITCLTVLTTTLRSRKTRDVMIHRVLVLYQYDPCPYTPVKKAQSIGADILIDTRFISCQKKCYDFKKNLLDDHIFSGQSHLLKLCRILLH